MLRVAALFLASCMVSAASASVINRCDAPDGILVYTDQTCASLGITDRTAPIARRRVGDIATAHRRNFSCTANSPDQLRQAVVNALDKGDFNALAGLYNFDGRSRWTAAPVVRRLERMAKRAALEVEIVERRPESLNEAIAMMETAELPSLRVVQYGTDKDRTLNIEQFRMARSAGCLWLGG